MNQLPSYLMIAFIIPLLTVVQPVFAAQRANKTGQTIQIQEDVLNIFIGEIEKNFHIAHRLLSDKDYKGAGQAIRRSIGFLKLEAARTGVSEKTRLIATIKALEYLAVSIQKGTLRSDQALRTNFSKSALALSRHYLSLFSKEYNSGNYILAGRLLQASVVQFETSAYWIEKDLSQRTTSTLTSTRKLSQTLQSKSPSSDQKVSFPIKQLKQELSSYEKKHFPSK